MKKLLLYLVLSVYVVSVSGASIERHYCMGRYVDLSVYFSKTEEACGKCGMEEKKGGCCHDEQQYLKLNTEHQSVETVIIPGLFEAIIPNINFDLGSTSYSTQEAVLPFSHGPPLRYDSKRYLLNRVFLI